jgi:hypothetical protein
MTVVVDGGAAAIEAECFAIFGVEGLDLSGKSIEKLKRHA